MCNIASRCPWVQGSIPGRGARVASHGVQSFFEVLLRAPLGLCSPYPTCCPLVRFSPKSKGASKMLRATGHARMVNAAPPRLTQPCTPRAPSHDFKSWGFGNSQPIRFECRGSGNVRQTQPNDRETVIEGLT